jgi:hypothetical protein
MVESSWITAQLVASEEGLSSMKLVLDVYHWRYRILGSHSSACDELSSGILCRVVHQKSTDISEKCDASRAVLATCFHAGFLLSLLFGPEYGGDTFLCNVRQLSTDCVALYPRRYNSSQPLLWESQTLYVMICITIWCKHTAKDAVFCFLFYALFLVTH